MKRLLLACLCLSLAACVARVSPPAQPLAMKPSIRPLPLPEARPAIPQAVEKIYFQGLVAYHRGQYQQALAKFSSVVKLAQHFSEAYWARGEVYYELKKLDLALRNYHQALQYDPRMVAAALQLARIYMQRQEYKDAKEQLQHVLTLDERQPIALELLEQCRQQAARHYLNKGQDLLQAGQANTALEQFKLALQEDPRLYQAWLEIGRLQQEQGENNQAIESYERALEINADLPLVWKTVGVLCLQSAAYDKARHAFQRSLILQPEQPEVQALLNEAQSNFYRLMELPEEYLQISFNPTLTRGELAAILAVNLRSVARLPQASDNNPLIIPDIADHWARQFVTYTVKHGWMQAYPNHNFLPSQAVTRGELAAILDSILVNLPPKSEIKGLDRPLIFTDLSPENQYYQAIMRVSALGLLTPYQQEGVFLPHKAVSGVEALEIVDRLVENL